MLAGYERTFNQVDFERRLRHYFSDSAPCTVRYKLNLDTIDVINVDNENSLVKIKLDSNATEEENIRIVIQECESHIYPFLMETVEEQVPVNPEEVVRQVTKGASLIEAMSPSKKRIVQNKFQIIRIGLNNNTIVIKSGGLKKVYELRYISVLKFLEFLRKGKYSPESGYSYLTNNSIEKAGDGEVAHG